MPPKKIALDVCPDCKSKVKKGDKGLACDICLFWYHAPCQDIDDSTYDVLSRDNHSSKSQVNWICGACAQGSANLMTVFRGLSVKYQDLEARVKETETSTSKIREDLDDQVKKQDDENEKIYEKIDNMGEKTMEQAINEMEERMMRRNNFVVHGIAPSDSDDPKVRTKHDEQEISKILSKSKVSANFNRVIRLGKNDGKPRPIRLTAANEDSARTFRTLGTQIKSADTGEYASISIRPDRTPFQRDTIRYLVKEKEKKIKESEDRGEVANWTINWRLKKVEREYQS